MKTIRFFSLIALSALCINLQAETRFGVRGGLSLVNNDISMITTESVQDEDTYSGFFIGPALTFEAEHLLGFDVGLMYQKTNFKIMNETYSQEFLEIPLSLRLKFGFEKLAIIGQFGPQWNINLGDIQTYFEDGEEIESDKVITTGNLGAGVRLFDKLELMLNFNVPWEVISDNFDDFSTMGDQIGKYKTVQFVVGWRF
ncbi:MAG: porin family protein [Bacteroidaceae bacterium]|nr:porin family protein [Bacteroidaceae bacterium]